MPNTGRSKEEREKKAEVARWLANNESPGAPTDKEWAKVAKEEREAFERAKPEDIGRAIKGMREYKDVYSGDSGQNRPRKHIRDGEERRAPDPPSWRNQWKQALSDARIEELQRQALHAVGRAVWLPGRGPHGKPYSRPLTREDFVSEEELPEFIATLAAQYDDGEEDVIEWAVSPSEEHPNGVAGRLFRWGYWRKDIAEQGLFARLPWNPLDKVKTLAEKLQRTHYLPLSQAVSLLLCNRVPDTPMLCGVTHSYVDIGNPARDRVMFSIEVRDPETVTPEQVRDFYASWREDVFGAGRVRRPYTTRMVEFVHQQKAEGLTWKQIHKLWNETHPEKTYKSWQAMQSVFSKRVRRA